MILVEKEEDDVVEDRPSETKDDHSRVERSDCRIDIPEGGGKDRYSAIEYCRCYQLSRRLAGRAKRGNGVYLSVSSLLACRNYL
jgi:hypothetical protein